MVAPRLVPGDAQPLYYDDSETVVYLVQDNPLASQDSFSSYDTDTDTDTSSIFSQHSASTLSSRDARGYFQEIDGRLYPVDPEIPIWMPQDEDELHRLDHEHMAIKLVVGGNYLGPTAAHLRYEPGVPRKRVLDVGTQQGSWVQEMASEFPHVEFVSLDVSPMAAHIPRENITFEVYDLYAGLAEADASFDMVHVRNTATKVANYTALVREIHRVLKPGGLFLSGELENETYDGSAPDTPAGDLHPRLSHALVYIRQALASQGVTVYAGRMLPEMLADPTLFARRSFGPALKSDSDSSSESSFSDNESMLSFDSAQNTPITPPQTQSNLSSLPSPLSACGFRQITPHKWNIPSTPWPDPVTTPALHEAGRQALLALQRGWPSLVTLLQACAGVSEDEARSMVSGALADHFEHSGLKIIIKYYTVWAYKI
ncbi:hypothetical protein BDV93DRAFT_523015 [Ceratobasidium sp. AG-I]|nr:hypothetical protein BDV93DRAFT_523015 [Ceratobasidium sp. AG-I]